ncbi:NUDIX hydrolase [Cytobacillus sp. IB215316]|uniref:NUDIX hydrolase n=1 Tax=Cytobacillus sp. IB215316 TaxID=3097354 RepID=UPI002A0B4266|nr:NUDIX domain-containing protein [Cytobacillus sp. IB215316]MDX8361475.1 NUDIX domain-containing protein [Cytobacillus sp. IB215316]
MFIVNVEGAINKDGKWLMIRRSMKEEHAGGELSLVGGKVEREGHCTDILEKTLMREIFEEVGIQVTILGYVNSSSFVTDLGEHVVDIVFLCEYESGKPFAKSPDEVDEVMWLTTEQVMNHEGLPDYLVENITLADSKLRSSKVNRSFC